MEGAGTERVAQKGCSANSSWLDLRLIALLLVIAAGIRVWVVARTEVPARDSIGYIRYAWRLQHEPWQQVVRSSERHPAYPVAIYLVSLPVRHLLAAPEAVEMQLSAQLASSLAGLLLVIPMYLLGRVLFDHTVGFWSALLFQCLPETGLVLSDALSEGVFLLFAASALLFAVLALRSGSAWQFGLCGLFGGLAFLTRPEGGLIVAVTGLVLLASQAMWQWRRPWLRVLACGASLGLVSIAVVTPFWLTVGRISTQPTTGHVINNGLVQRQLPRGDTGIHGGQPLFACAFGVWHAAEQSSQSVSTNRYGWGLRAVAQETVKAFHYVTWLPALLGLWWFRDRFPALLGTWVLLLLCGLIALALWRVAALMGYTSDRHALLIVLCGTFWGVAGIRVMAGRAADLCRRLMSHRPGWSIVASERCWAAGLLLTLIASGLPKTLAPLHADRAGHRTAGLWLAEHAGPGDIVDDPFCWAHYYAGKVFLEGLAVPAPAVRYIVLENSQNPHSHLVTLADAQKRAEHAREVFRCPLRRSKGGERAEIVVYSTQP